ncbi:MAG: metallophosphoesterase [Acidobacteriota bacterium]|nr:metallophosphoesterase [Acidobacteriota bacterium]
MKIGLGVTALIVVSLLVYAFIIEPDQLVVNEVTLNVQQWPAELNGLRLVAISDLHAGAPHIDDAKLEQVVAEINRLNPDLVVILGDFVISEIPGGEFVAPEATAEKLKNLRAPGGVHAVLGNHDWWEGGPQVISALQGAGIRVLENDAISVRHRGQTVWLVGLADL